MSKESAVRDAAAALHATIMEARGAGLVVTWPHRAEDLLAISVSETKKAAVTVAVDGPSDVPAETLAKASAAAQKAADRVVEKN
jgi:hypothetical protein